MSPTLAVAVCAAAEVAKKSLPEEVESSQICHGIHWTSGSHRKELDAKEIWEVSLLEIPKAIQEIDMGGSGVQGQPLYIASLRIHETLSKKKKKSEEAM